MLFNDRRLSETKGNDSRRWHMGRETTSVASGQGGKRARLDLNLGAEVLVACAAAVVKGSNLHFVIEGLAVDGETECLALLVTVPEAGKVLE